jgi:hypothetical protein
MKKKTPISKHDIIRAIKSLRIRMDRLYSILLIQQQEIREYIEFMGNSKEFEEYLAEKYEREQSERDGSGGDTRASEK